MRRRAVEREIGLDIQIDTTIGAEAGAPFVVMDSAHDVDCVRLTPDDADRLALALVVFAEDARIRERAVKRLAKC